MKILVRSSFCGFRIIATCIFPLRRISVSVINAEHFSINACLNASASGGSGAWVSAKSGFLEISISSSFAISSNAVSSLALAANVPIRVILPVLLKFDTASSLLKLIVKLCMRSTSAFFSGFRRPFSFCKIMAAILMTSRNVVRSLRIS